MSKRICIIGGGASGLYCAVTLKRLCPELAVTIIEKNTRVGKKLLATGNGKCNFTNYKQAEYNYASDAPDNVFKIIASHPPKAIVDTFERLGIRAIEKEGLVYPRSAQASTVVDALRFSAEELGVRTLTETEVKNIKYKNGCFCIDTSENICADAVIIATGSSASGGSASGLKFLRSFGHSIKPTYPALTGLICDTYNIRMAKGMRAQCTAALTKNGKQIAKEDGEVLFTEYGLSGICIMQLSRHVAKAKADKEDVSFFVNLDLAPETDIKNLTKLYLSRRSTLAKRNIGEFLSGYLNKQIGFCVLRTAGIYNTDKPICTLTDTEIETIAKCTKQFAVAVTGTRDESQAQACGGGAPLCEFSFGLQSKLQDGLYACGEVLDVLGDCGGYNLTWAFASAYSVAKDIVNKK